MTWIQTYTGVAWDLEAPRAENVRAVDIAHSLARLARFTGHTRTTGIYSVAQHSVLVSRRCAALADAWPAERRRLVALAGLLHDAHEAYIGDTTRPMKAALIALADEMCHDAGAFASVIAEIEAMHAQCIETWARLPWMPGAIDVIRLADDELLATEARELMGPPPTSWGLRADPLPWRIEPWVPSEAEERFAAEYHRLNETEDR